MTEPCPTCDQRETTCTGTDRGADTWICPECGQEFTVTVVAEPVRRVLVTGSRTWTRAAVIRDALAAVWGDGARVLVSGGCPRGGTRIAEGIWSRWGGRVERATPPTGTGRDGPRGSRGTRRWSSVDRRSS